MVKEITHEFALLLGSPSYNAQDSYQIAYPVESSSMCSLIVNRVYEDFVEKWHGDF